MQNDRALDADISDLPTYVENVLVELLNDLMALFIRFKCRANQPPIREPRDSTHDPVRTRWGRRADGLRRAGTTANPYWDGPLQR